MRKMYLVLSDSKPAIRMGEADTMAEALSVAAELTTPVFVQQYVAGKVGKSFTVPQLAERVAQLTK
jgi:hypothetical protein